MTVSTITVIVCFPSSNQANFALCQVKNFLSYTLCPASLWSELRCNNNNNYGIRLSNNNSQIIFIKHFSLTVLHLTYLWENDIEKRTLKTYLKKYFKISKSVSTSSLNALINQFVIFYYIS